MNKHYIALIAPFPPPYGGMGVRFEQMANSLEKQGIKVKRIRLRAANSRLSRFVLFFKPALQIFRLKLKIIHVVTGSIPNFIALVPIFLAAKLSGKKIILSNGGGYWKREAISHSIRSLLVKLVLKLPNIVICCNTELAEAISCLGVPLDKIAQISNALPDEKGTRESIPVPEKFTDIREGTETLLLYIGALKPWYGLLETLMMTASLRQEGHDCTLIALVKEGGDKEFHSAVLSRTEDLCLGNYFHIFTSVPWAVSAMTESDIFIRATNTIEGDSRAVREALAVGIPVIASDIGNRPDGVCLFKAGDAASMFNAAISVLENLDIFENMERIPMNNREGELNLQKTINLYSKLDLKKVSHEAE